MAWFNLFSGPTAERLEHKGDALGAAGFWGAAKLEYERAYRKLEAAPVQDQGTLYRLEEKIAATREALAGEHHRKASDLAAIGDFKEALDLVELALALTDDGALKATLDQQRREIETIQNAERRQTLSAPEDVWDPEEESVGVQSPDEAFRALCGTLPDPVRRAYLGYGADFKTGYLALNNGDFETAADDLARALETRNAADSYIPLELATACLQLNRPEQARQLLETLLQHHPDTLPAYQILCEIYWEQGAFDRADALLASIPGDLATSLAVFVLKGETLFQAGHFDVAKTFYRDFLSDLWLGRIHCRCAGQNPRGPERNGSCAPNVSGDHGALQQLSSPHRSAGQGKGCRSLLCRGHPRHRYFGALSLIGPGTARECLRVLCQGRPDIPKHRQRDRG